VQFFSAFFLGRALDFLLGIRSHTGARRFAPFPYPLTPSLPRSPLPLSSSLYCTASISPAHITLTNASPYSPTKPLHTTRLPPTVPPIPPLPPAPPRTTTTKWVGVAPGHPQPSSERGESESEIAGGG
jgi:hypothetical protein